MANHPKYEAAREALSDVHGDTTVDRETTRDALQELAADIDGMLEALNEDERAEADAED